MSPAAAAHRQAAAARDARRCCHLTNAITIALYLPIAALIIAYLP